MVGGRRSFGIPERKDNCLESRSAPSDWTTGHGFLTCSRTWRPMIAPVWDAGHLQLTKHSPPRYTYCEWCISWILTPSLAKPRWAIGRLGSFSPRSLASASPQVPGSPPRQTWSRIPFWHMSNLAQDLHIRYFCQFRLKHADL